MKVSTILIFEFILLSQTFIKIKSVKMLNFYFSKNCLYAKLYGKEQVPFTCSFPKYPQTFNKICEC